MIRLRENGNDVYGWSIIREDNTVKFPIEVIERYGIGKDSDIILFSGSEISGGFCLSILDTLRKSKLSGIVENNKILEDNKEIGKIISYKGKSYCHMKIIDNKIKLTDDIIKEFDLEKGDKLLVVYGSNIAISCLKKGPIIELANESEKIIDVF